MNTYKQWRRREFPPAGFAEELGLAPFHAHLLYNRGIRQSSDVETYLKPDERLLNDPLLLPDMAIAVARLKQALDSDEVIGIFGDFDADGITGTALLIRALRDLGATVIPHLPDRVYEGHGLNDEAIRSLKEQDVSLLITVDCGATSIDEVDTANSLGMDTIITDHHTVLPALPKARALINPNHPDSSYPYDGLTGVGMAFKLVEALHSELGLPWPEHLLELVALGTIADVGPLTGENRYLVKMGIEQINETQSPGINALASNARLKMGSIDTESLSFGIIPRINVAGRLGRADVSLALLTATSMDTAQSLASQLEHQNQERQSLTHEGVSEAQWQVEAKMNGNGPPAILIVQSKDWIPGILGLIAGRLSEQYYRPAIAISFEGDMCRASARSIPEFNIIEAIRASEELYIKHGGHHQAAGFTMPTSSLPLLEQRLHEFAERELDGMELMPSLDIDCEVPLAMFAKPENFNFIQSLAPFGEANPAPVFITRNARVVETRLVGGQGQHLKMKVWQDGVSFGAIAFRQGDKVKYTHGPVDLVYTVSLDTWGYQPKLQLTVQDFRPTYERSGAKTQQVRSGS